jgi:DNA-binding NarL/FixJ family response regulator
LRTGQCYRAVAATRAEGWRKPPPCRPHHRDSTGPDSPYAVHTGRVTVLRIAVVEDEPLYRELLSTSLIAHLDEIEVIGSFASGEELFAQVGPTDIDVLLTDVDLGPGIDGTQVGIRMRRSNPRLGVVLLSNFAMPELLAGLPDDVRGGWSYLLKTSVADLDQLGLAIRESAAGGVVIDSALTKTLVPQGAGPLHVLTPRQVDVVARMANGWSNKRIAEDLVLSVRTVESVISDIIAALAIPSDTDGYNARVACVLLYLQHTVSKSEIPTSWS